MKPAFLFALVLTLLPGCGLVEREVAKVAGFSRMCVDGVEYLQFASGASVAWTPDGKVKLCESK